MDNRIAGNNWRFQGNRNDENCSLKNKAIRAMGSFSERKTDGGKKPFGKNSEQIVSFVEQNTKAEIVKEEREIR